MSALSAFLPDWVALVSQAGAAPAAAPAAATGGAVLSDSAAILIVLLAGYLPTEIWRALAVFAGRQVEEGSPVFHWVKAVATALLAAVVARLVFVPTGALVAVPLLVRLCAVGGGVAAFLLVRRSVFAGVIAGEIILVGGALLMAP